ncbi:Sugar or nucleoside kinase, ribokinase family [Parapedobacter indicus]|uniref:Sugar or nucleoside kinase, ribokinase family n=2 Tax=Parapedobacter indicus TaxID=1477437 RepID=A0A1I3KDE2_9SPHI|nr:sugar/nucleoside kinase (ribokinase family) [Parapedobacter indicus]SFI70298.1 Sugar or nucleoside kinase, ribokinase family [Parapedobacter indicus]
MLSPLSAPKPPKRMENNYDVIVVGELNVDLILNHISTFPQIGKEVLARDMQMTLGSSSAIFASNLSTLGAKVLFKGATGNDMFGDFVISELSERGVDTSAIVRNRQLKTGATVAINIEDDRAMVTHPGAMEHYSAEDVDVALLSRAKHLHISSVFLQPALKHNLLTLLSKAKSCNLTTSLDTQWDPAEKWELDLPNVLPLVDVFLPNEAEIKCLTHQPTVESALNQIGRYANTVVVKLGVHGSISYYKGTPNNIPPFLNNAVVDAIGAGDSFNAGFIYRYLSGAPINDCQRFGNVMGALSTTAPGGTGAFTSRAAIMKKAKDHFNYTENDVKR